ncbi:uncharacterized protein PGTG_02023 [Puccinia graminis f. sp. tritici CRL 75-36-700-3]|uniref:Oligopeptide transporter n=2 Tax=Puccinia graminis f. sp. tritici TaxID=56615 RepID=E3JWY7_PUCGT|nr:uncharacterized protein PGTG_02023 [Puccinia graminis f. sp. tritici CRL 75-36-700-3]EFP76562.2 hypothetical protein PGTG_02023 [Puccinia graminis f. sp. tritici CRL 75-36-700-3]
MENLRKDNLNEKAANLTRSTETIIPSEPGLDLPPPLLADGLEAERKTETPVPDEKLDIVPLQDDAECPVMTVRSVLVGVVLSAYGVAITQLFFFKPVHMQIKLMFLQIASVLIGRSCALIPGPRWWNPGPFSLKEAGFSALMGTTASGATLASEMIVAYELYFGQVINFGIAFGILLSSQLIGVGWAGLLQPVLVYPSRAVYPEALPSVSLLNSLFKVGAESADQVKFFKKAFLAVAIYEIFPTYITPAFQAISTFCLTLPKNQLTTIIFGGARPFEGMGMFSFSADWSMIGDQGPLYMPLSTQIHQLVALVISTLAYFLVYSKSMFDSGLSQNFPFMSTSLLTSGGKPYPYRQAINNDGTANEEFIKRTGIPFFTATFYLVQILRSVCFTSSISHAILHNYHVIGSLFMKSKRAEKIDPHRLACMKYKDFPQWGFAAIVLVAVALTFGMSSLSNSGISFVGLLVALVGSFLMTLGTGFIYAITGFVVQLTAGVQMFVGLLFPGNVFGIMWFTVYGASSALQGFIMLMNLKYGQYLHLPQNLVVRSQLLGCMVGCLTTLAIVKSILKYEHDVLLLPNGNGVFSGAGVAAFQARSFWARKYRKQWFKKYNYILSAALDGGTELVVFFLAMIFQGGGGKNINFPTYFLNPVSSTPRDYCYMNPEARRSN